MEAGCPGTWGLELPTPNPGSRNIPKACPTRNPVASPTRHTQPQPKHLSPVLPPDRAIAGIPHCIQRKALRKMEKGPI